MKKADKSNANLALIIGEDEVTNKTIKIKFLRNEGLQEDVSDEHLMTYLSKL